MWVLEVERLELALNPSVQLLIGTVDLFGALLENLKAESLILSSEQDLAVLVDLLDTSEDAEEVIVDWLRAGCERCLILLGEHKVGVESIEQLLLSFNLSFAIQDDLGFIQHRTRLSIGGSDVLPHFCAAVIQAGDRRTNAFELLSHLAKVLDNFAIALDEFLLNIETQIPAGFCCVTKLALVKYIQSIPDLKVGIGC